MTALPPIENRRVVGLKDGQMKLLRKLVLNRVCAHPDCDRETDDAHHIWARSKIANDSWYVEITEDDGSKRVLLHVTGLCRPHHDAVELHYAWIKYEDGEYVWYDRSAPEYEDYVAGMRDQWASIGPLSPQPGQVEQKKKRKRKQGEARRARRTVSLAVPQDEQEDGAGILDDLVQTGREEWAEQLGWKENVPAYFVICAAFAKAFSSP